MQKYLAEFTGTIFFVYIILATGNPLAIGAALALVILLASNISGGHFNPAVSIVMASAGKINTSELIPYCLSQILGGLVALELYKRYKIDYNKN
jgi:aquaporin Z